MVSGAGAGVAVLRIEGPEPSIAYRGLELVDMLGEYAPTAILDFDDTDLLWRELLDATLLVEPRDRFVWRISVTPSKDPPSPPTSTGAPRPSAIWTGRVELVWAAVEEGATDAAAES